MANHNPTNARAKVITKLLPGQYKVEVWGAYPYDYVKTYTLKAKSDTDAAREGIRLFNQTLTWKPKEENT